MAFLAFLKIAYLTETPRDFLALSLVCREARRACEHLKEFKQWQFERLFVAYDGDRWKLFQDESAARDWSLLRMQRGVLAIGRYNVYDRPLVFRMRRLEIYNLVSRERCSDWNLRLKAFQIKQIILEVL
jgi:hypothetical protein